MKRLMPWLVPLLFGFTLSEFQPQTSRVRWETSYQGATYSTVTPTGTTFAHKLTTTGLTGVGGLAYFRGDTITCTWAVAGTTDGGTNLVIVDIVSDTDGGVLCSCSLGTCAGSAAVEKSCACASGAFQTPLGATLSMMLDAGASGESCWTYPAQMKCTIDLFR